jgi:transposase
MNFEFVAKQRDDDLREQFFADVSLYKPEMLIFIDESGSDNRDTLRKYGYSIRGKPPRSLKLLVRGERVSVIAALSNDGVETLRVVRGTVDGDTFLEFVERDLLPVLQPFNGVNPNYSVVIMDNCSVHHVANVKSLISEVGALLHYLPPYSPDLNPIEECFSKVKSCLKSTEIDNDDLETAVLAAFTCVTPDDCEGWIRDSKVYTSN